MKQKRILSMLLCLLLASALLLSACGGETETGESSQSSATSDSSSQVAQTSDPYKDADGNYTLAGVNMPEFKFDYNEFRVCVYSKEVQTTYFSEEIAPDLYDTTDDVLNEAVRQRNDRVLGETGVSVVAYAVRDVNETVKQGVQNSLDEYDAAMPFMGACTVLAQDGMLMELHQFSDYIHLDAPWWDQVATESLSIANKLYFTTGDISIMQKITSNAVAFNKQLYKDNCEGEYGDLYQIVRDGKWTVDLMHEMGKLGTYESDGDAGMTYKDNWGLFGSNGSAIGFYESAGMTLIRKNQKDEPELALGADQRSVLYAQKLLDMLHSGNEWYFNVNTLQGQVPNIWQVSVDVFGENRALFYGCAFSAIKKLRAYDSMYPFGLIPLPKASEEQETYYTPGSSAYAYGVCIPKGVRDPEFSAYMLEMLSCYAKNTVTYAYYDVILKSRDSKDQESEDMLDEYIFHNIVYDLGLLYDFGGVSSMFNTLMTNDSCTLASELDSRKDSINMAILACLEAYELDD